MTISYNKLNIENLFTFYDIYKFKYGANIINLILNF